MSDVAAAPADSAPAPVDGAPIADVGTNFNSPLGSQIPPDAVAKPETPKPSKSIDDSIDRAIAKSAAKTAEPAKAEPKAQEKPETAKTEQPREKGKFVAVGRDGGGEAGAARLTDTKPKAGELLAEAPLPTVKPSHTAEDAPARFTETAKAKWAAADPEIRGETLRMHRELTEGYQKHKEKADKYDAIKDFDEMATRSGTTIKDALSRYVSLDLKAQKDLPAALDEICSHRGTTLREVAAHILGQTPDQVQSQSDATIRELKQTVAELQQQVGGVTQTIQQQHQRSTLQEVTKFASEPEHSRFEELADDIGFFMKSGRAKDLSEAYTLAERLNPAPAQATAVPAEASSAPAPAPAVHPDKGQKSINGAPSSLNSSGKKRVALSLDESLDRAFGAVG